MCHITNVQTPPNNDFSAQIRRLFVSVRIQKEEDAASCIDGHITVETLRPVWALIFNTGPPLGRGLEFLSHTHKKKSTHSIRRDRPRQTLKLQIRVTCTYTCMLSAAPLLHPLPLPVSPSLIRSISPHPRESPLRHSATV